MKKLINLTILFTTILSLTFIHAIPTNAASKVTLKQNLTVTKIKLLSKIN